MTAVAIGLGSNLEPRLEAAIQRVLLGMDEDEEGRRILEDFQSTTRFDPIPATDRAAVARLAEGSASSAD